jgi:hypothetical protein
VIRENGIVGDDRQTLESALCNEDAVERVTMLAAHSTRLDCMPTDIASSVMVGLTKVAFDSIPTDMLDQSVFYHRLSRGSYVRSETASDQSTSAGRATSIMYITDTTSSGFALRATPFTGPASMRIFHPWLN